MKNKLFSIVLVALVVSAAGCTSDDTRRTASTQPAQSAPQSSSIAHSTTSGATQKMTGGNLADRQADGHAHGAAEETDVPAFETDAASLKKLPPTLAPEQFSYAKTRQAYQMVKEIPETIAQLPCYCHCDRGFGHKSLHSCFVDNHASQCTVCIDEAMVAYRLQKEEKLKPAQIRERIIAKYSTMQ